MPYLIDTDVLSDHLADDPATVQLLQQPVPDGISISMITYMEAYQGVLQSPDPAAAQAKFAAFIAQVPVVPFSHEVARRCAELRLTLKQEGKRVRPRALDLITAATALQHNLTLVTRNLDDYRDIPQLVLA
jgi:predicted nucleic acid-binding protein